MNNTQFNDAHLHYKTRKVKVGESTYYHHSIIVDGVVENMHTLSAIPIEQAFTTLCERFIADAFQSGDSEMLALADHVEFHMKSGTEQRHQQQGYIQTLAGQYIATLRDSLIFRMAYTRLMDGDVAGMEEELTMYCELIRNADFTTAHYLMEG